MILTILFIVIAIMILDLHLMLGHDTQRFQKVFQMQRLVVIGLLAALFVILVLSGDLIRMFAIYFLLVILPYYLIKRRRYMAGFVAEKDFLLMHDAYGVVLHWIFGGVIISTVISAYFDFILQFTSEFGEIMLSAMGSSLLLMVLIYRSAKKLSPEGFLRNVALVKGRSSWAQLLLWPLLAGLMCAGISAYIIVYRETLVETPLSGVITASQSTDLFLIFLFLAICIAPAVEEIVFRGYFYHVLERVKGFIWAFFIVSVSFAVLHVGQYWGDWMAIAMIAVIGFILTGLRAYSGSTISSMVMHYTYNACVTVLPIIMLVVKNPSYFEFQSRYHELDDPQKEALLMEAIQESPTMAEIHYELAQLYLHHPAKLVFALESIDHALSFQPSDRTFLELKADILERLGRYQEALPIRVDLLKQNEFERSNGF